MIEQTLRHQADRRWVTLVPTICDFCNQHCVCDQRTDYITSTLTGEVYAELTINICYGCDEEGEYV